MPPETSSPLAHLGAPPLKTRMQQPFHSLVPRLTFPEGKLRLPLRATDSRQNNYGPAHTMSQMLHGCFLLLMMHVRPLSMKIIRLLVRTH